ncbi:hypothetical protein TPHA_0E00750 [Tetrapisispora phaffii CBS 4417]|uniref:HTH APSES-type domain-containing protein n=1 Tax=Tetrapisispora phaffii (strain ATCC 24235 / CBS 4417 / NBRC 1672 / NRRL Y-8282 / UCD 70-5) TaxID=1071381 RepID=G8BTE2_TETPH|nr:hypothetical protein TPHA_0E00750 [Tetrapisispora phaffii CBS 4417]CCE63170.1 hypothetical protein TPHA_0E00750 [Tetrapisispora phaffii CBS 4417]
MVYNQIVMFANNSNDDGVKSNELVAKKEYLAAENDGSGSNIQTQQPYSANTLNITGGVNLTSNTPIIEIATYSEIDVYECYVRGFESRIVMRRKNNDWVNITQVLKLASFSKTKRTKIIEKESMNMEHEKVQGGYGRFQGTWIPLSSTKELIEKYNIDDPVISALVNFVLDPDNPPPRRSKNSILKKTSPGMKINSPSSYNKTPKKNNVISGSSTSTSTNGNKKNRKKFGSGSGQLLRINPSPLSNVFQTPQLPNGTSHSNGNMSANTIIDTTVESVSTLSNTEVPNVEGQKETNNTSRNPSFAANGYSATQKPLQFFPVPTISGYNSVNNNNNLNSNSNVNVVRKPINSNKDQLKFEKNGTKNPKESSFLTFIPDSRNKTFTSSEHMSVNPVHYNNSHMNNKDSKDNTKNTKRRKKKMDDDENNDFNDENSMIRNGNATVQDKTQQNFKVIKQQMIGSNFHNLSLPNSSRSIQSNSAVSSSSTHVPSESTPYSQFKITANDIPVVSEQEYKEIILQTLSSEDIIDASSLPLVLYHPPASLDINFEVDNQGHTALHWATAMSNVPLIKLLISMNIDIFKSNKRGFNCITKMIFYNNCYKAGTFAEIISILKMCLITSDDNNRIPLHYLVELSVNKSKDPQVINYYIETIFKILANENYSLLRLCLYHQDNMGNTLLHLAALNLNIDLYNKLIELGASKDIPNFDSKTPAAILSKFNLLPNEDIENIEYMQGIELQEGFQSPQSNKPKYEHLNNEHKKHTNLDINVINSPYRVKLHNNNEHNLLGHEISNNDTFTMEDISELDNLVTSSVVKDTDELHHNLLKNSPMLYKSKSNSELGRNVLQQPITLNEPKARNPSNSVFDNDMTTEESISNIHDIEDDLSIGSNSVKQTYKLAILTSNLNKSIKSDVRNMQEEISKNKRKVDVINYQLEGVDNQRKTLIDQMSKNFKINKIDELHDKLKSLHEEKDALKKQFLEKFERTQHKIYLQNVKDIESSELKNTYNGQSIEMLAKEDIKKLIEEVKNSKEQKRTTIKNIADAVATMTSSDKIEKYRKLIGLTIENVDAKLDEIEYELSMNM